MFNLAISFSLFIYAYGIDETLDNGIFVGGAIVVIIYMLTGAIWRDFSNKKLQDKE